MKITIKKTTGLFATTVKLEFDIEGSEMLPSDIYVHELMDAVCRDKFVVDGNKSSIGKSEFLKGELH